MSLLQNSNAISSGGYNIANSLRFQSASSQYLSRTYASGGNQQVMTWSCWFKRGTLGVENKIYQVGSSGVYEAGIDIQSNDTLRLYDYTVAAGFRFNLVTTQVFRDPSAWYHLVVAIDTTQATSSNRIKLYINGVQVTALGTATYPSQNLNTNWNLNNTYYIGRYYAPSATNFDGYMTEVNFIDGQALTPSSFGETNTLTGQWVAKKYTGTYGTNGFYLPFSNGTSTTTLGYDSSGNSNNWTLNNFTRSAGTSDCWMYDVPSGNGSAGTQPNSNYSTLNPLKVSGATLALANLRATTSEGQFYTNTMNIPSTGKWYWEFTLTSITGGSNQGVLNGVAPSNSVFSGFPNASSFAVTATLALSSNWVIYQNGSVIYSSSKPFVAGDVVQYALDRDNQRFWLGVNGTWYATGTPNPATNTSPTISYTTTGDLEIMCQGGGGGAGSSVVNWNFGQRSFAYTPPSGFKALCTANLPASTIVKGNQYMDATTYTGNGATGSGALQSISTQFSPNFLWLKNRTSGSSNHILIDSIRGNNSLSTNNTSGDIANGNQALGTNSYLVAENNGAGIAYNPNLTGNSYVGWVWNAGSSTVTNTSGSISSQVRANPTAGVSVATFTATSGSYSVGHGLGIAPSMTIVKRRDSATGGSWWTWHIGIGNNTSDYLELNSTAAEGSVANMWGTVGRNSTVCGFNGTASTVAGGTFVMYNFAEIAGFSKFGSYTGNGSTDGPMVWTGFAPRYVMIKQTNGANDWWVMDTARDPYNVGGAFLSPNLSNAESSGNVFWDALSNGFKLRNLYSQVNGNGNTYIYMAFASNPFSSSNAK